VHALWMEEYKNNVYSRSWHRKFGSKTEVLCRMVEIRDRAGTVLIRKEFVRWPQGKGYGAIAWVIAKYDSDLLPLLLGEKFVSTYAERLMRRKEVPA
jgi:hypothetical protein